MAMNLYVDGKLERDRVDITEANRAAGRLNDTGRRAVKVVYIDPDTGKPLSKEDMTPTSTMEFG